MKKITTSLVAFCLPLMAIGADFHTSAPVVAAKLYTQEAEITREARIQINEAGAHRIWVSPILSTNLNDLSVQLSGAQLISQSTTPILSAENHPLWAEIDQAEAALTLASQALAENEKLADAIIKSGETSENDFANIQSKLAELQTERAELIANKHKQQTALMLLKMRAEWLGIKRDSITQAIVFDIVTENSGEIVLQLFEPTSQASWQPYSEFRLDSEKKQIQVRAGAQVTQNTGLNWDQVSLTLALTPLNYVERPALQTSSIAVADRVVTRTNPPISRLTTPAPASVMMLSEQEKTTEYASAPPVMENNGLDFTVVLNGRYNLTSGSDRHQIPYLQETNPAEIYSAVYSWTQPRALLIGRWTQARDSGFIPGETSLYRDGNRLAALYFGEIWTGGAEHVLSFGQDPQLDVTFHMPPNYTAGSGFIIKDKVHERRETIDVKNLAKVAKPVRIYTRIPIATQQEITVDGKFNPPPSIKDAENIKGIYLWEKTLSPDESFKVKSGYDIRYPEDKRLIGLD